MGHDYILLNISLPLDCKLHEKNVFSHSRIYDTNAWLLVDSSYLFADWVNKSYLSSLDKDGF